MRAVSSSEEIEGATGPFRWEASTSDARTQESKPFRPPGSLRPGDEERFAEETPSNGGSWAPRSHCWGAGASLSLLSLRGGARVKTDPKSVSEGEKHEVGGGVVSSSPHLAVAPHLLRRTCQCIDLCGLLRIFRVLCRFDASKVRGRWHPRERGEGGKKHPSKEKDGGWKPELPFPKQWVGRGCRTHASPCRAKSTAGGGEGGFLFGSNTVPGFLARSEILEYSPRTFFVENTARKSPGCCANRLMRSSCLHWSFSLLW